MGVVVFDFGGMYEDETSGTSLKKRVMGIRCPPCRVRFSILFPSSIHLGCSDSDSFTLDTPRWIGGAKWEELGSPFQQDSSLVNLVMVLLWALESCCCWWWYIYYNYNTSGFAGVAGGETGVRDDARGLLKLRDDVQMCAYNDVQVMWNMLSKCPPNQELKGATGAAPNTSKCRKHRLRFT